MSKEFNALLYQLLGKLQRYHRLRHALAILCVCGLIGLALNFLYQMLPRQFSLSIAGSDVVSNRYDLTKALQTESLNQGIYLRIQPTADITELMARLDRHELDLALVQEADAERYPNIVQIATLPPEALHVLVRPGIGQLTDLQGRQINLGLKHEEWHQHAMALLAFAGLRLDRDYLEANLSQEALMSLPASMLPDAIVTSSFIPSTLAEFLIQQRGYRLLDFPFPHTPPTQLGWARASQIPAFVYGAAPAMPPHPLPTAGIHLHLVGHKAVDAKAVYALLDTLYSPAMRARTGLPFDEQQISSAAGYPLAEGSRRFLSRNTPLISTENFEKLKSMLGLCASIVSALLVALRWFRGEPLSAS
ncbi:hypothetical protein BXU06_03425 [Aquaspirillum sp. LM1]|uniref:TAXI family TRAP transporter solute-binding subunit n=1 Tax=Aquaspirillum sp. LM1 TaxID=1938604 RepID=UPI000983F7F8|nr:TAXI family TRAP transporter solute-binding subunit [Aquaspirillum sp. LM1]AQR64211.1 hypothetical protein BXU06_03425 [Aquaspirillum sp. LM1]